MGGFPNVSIIIPIFNIERYLERCIKSVQRQTYQDIEIILIDDGSTDQSPAICDALCAYDKRIKVVHQRNKGVSAARNVGIKLAAGEWVMFVDGDDWIDPYAVEQLYLRTQESCDVVAATYTWERQGTSTQASTIGFEEHTYKSVDKKKYLLGLCLVRPTEIPVAFPEDMHKCPAFGVPIAKLYRKTFLINNQIHFPEDIEMGEDRFFNLQVMYHARSVKFVNISIYHYCIRTGSALNSELSFMFDKRISHIKAIFLFIQEKLLVHDLSVYYNFYCFMNIREMIQYMSMSLNSICSFFNSFKKIKKMLKTSIYMDSFENLCLSDISAVREKIIFILLKMRLFSVTLFICWCYYAVFSKRNRLKVIA